MARRALRTHQVGAVQAAVAALGVARATGAGPAAGLRATVVSACGTGKTLVGSRVAGRLVPRGRVLVLVPTLDLLTQTVTAWREDGQDGTAVAVCSLEKDAALQAARVRATTIPAQLALWGAQSRPLTVFGTYTSLDVIEQAHQGPYGTQPLAPWDLVVVDEAHRTSGNLGKPWASVHDDTRIPAARRLYLTATPRIWEAPGTELPVRRDAPPARNPRPDSGDGPGVGVAGEPAAKGRVARTAVREPKPSVRDRLPERFAASMDDEALFGKRVFELPLAEAIDRGLLARYRILVLEIRDREAWVAQNAAAQAPEDAQLREAARGARLAALQAAVLTACAEHGLRTVLTFHQRTSEARVFAVSLPEVAQRLRDARKAVPADVWSGWLYGRHSAEERRSVIGRFAAGASADGAAGDGASGGTSVLANVKVVAEGVDIPAVDAVAFCDPKGSIVDIVQAVGRALRQQPRQGKLASLLVPVFLAPDAPEDELFAMSAYEPLAVVLQALRAHDSDIVDRLAVPQATGLSQDAPFGVTVLGETLRGAGEPADAGEDAGRWAREPLLRFSTRRDPAEIAEFVRLRVIMPESRVWRQGLAAAKRFHARTGHLRVALDHWEGPFPLGRWISEQRRVYHSGGMDQRRVYDLDHYGMVWRVPDVQFAEGLAMAAAWAQLHGHLAAPADAVFDGYPVGQWLKNQRRAGALDKHPERRAQLEAVDPWWNPAWPVDWQRKYTQVRRHLHPDIGTSAPPTSTRTGTAANGVAAPEPAAGQRTGRRGAAEGRAAAPAAGVPGKPRKTARLDAAAFELVVAGEDLGTWLRRQVAGWKDLQPEQRALLGGIGVAAPRVRRPARTGSSAAGTPAVQEPVGGGARGEAAAAGTAAAGAPVGGAARAGGRVSRTHEEKFQIGLAAAAQYRARVGHLVVPRKHLETVASGPWAGEAVKLGVWLANQRLRADTLTTERRLALTEMGIRW